VAQNVISPTAFDLMFGLFEINLFESFARIVKERAKIAHLRAAVLGADPRFFTDLEAVMDSGLVEITHFWGHAGDIFHPSQPVDQFRFDDYDIVVVLAQDANVETEILTSIQDASARVTRPCPIVLMSRLRHSYFSALNNVLPEHYGTCLNPRKLGFIVASLFITRDWPGYVVECGVYQGGTSILMALLLDQWGDPRRIVSFDTFDGMPAPVLADGTTPYQAGLFTDTSLDAVQGHVDAHGAASRIQLHKGLVQDCLPRVLTSEQAVSFALVDTDQYVGTAAGLAQIVPKLATGGLIMVDDYGVEGVRRAIEEAKMEFPRLRGALLTTNFYLLWLEHAEPGVPEA
jgi:hypothetical protein